MENNYYSFVNLPLPYSYNALEPFIDEKTMQLHHDKHLQTYINNLNSVLKENPEMQKYSLEQLIKISCKLPLKLRASIHNNAGGVYNHRFFFNGLTANSKISPDYRLINQIKSQFGSLEKFKAHFKESALSAFGSGYSWLVQDRCGLKIITTPNQESPIEKCLHPIITIDVWEHAYYLKHYNVRADYIDDWFKLINWEQAEKNYLSCVKY